MAKPMPDNAFLQGPFAPIQMECDVVDLIVEGEIPKDLTGSLYRNGPNQRFAPQGEHHFFGGDGMLHAFHINNGKVDYRNRYARTAKWKIEDQLGKSVINPMNPFDCAPEFSDFVLTDKEGLANTAVLWHGDRLVLMEEGHLPFEVDPQTLESKGSFNYYGKLKTAMTAHPKVDPKTGELIFFAYMSEGPFNADVSLYKVSPEGIFTESLVIPTPYAAMIHDFVVTENYILFPIMPITGDLERAMLGKPPFAWEPEKGVFIGVMPRDGSAEDIQWIEADICFVFHFMNGFDKDGVITVDACQFERAPLFPNPDGSAGERSQSHLHRWTIDMNDPNRRLQTNRIDEYTSEFPQIDRRYSMQDYRYGFYVSSDNSSKSDAEGKEAFFNVLATFDHQTNQVERYCFGNGVASEAIFVPKDNGAEGEGYLLTVVLDLETQVSGLYVMDAQNVSQGPIAVAKLSHRIPVGFHGTFRPGS